MAKCLLLPLFTCLSLCSFVSSTLDLSSINAAQLERQVHSMRTHYAQFASGAYLPLAWVHRTMGLTNAAAHFTEAQPQAVDAVAAAQHCPDSPCCCCAADQGARCVLGDPASQRHAPRVHTTGCGSPPVRAPGFSVATRVCITLCNWVLRTHAACSSTVGSHRPT